VTVRRWHWGTWMAAGLTALLTIGALAGCGEGIYWPGVTSIRWHGPTYPEAHAVARKADKLTFVYFRNWYRKECTDFEEHVLRDWEVVAETRPLICVMLDFDWDRPLADRWELKAAPAFVITAPDDEVLARQGPPITKQDVLRAIRGAREKRATQTPKTSAPARAGRAGTAESAPARPRTSQRAPAAADTTTEPIVADQPVLPSNRPSFRRRALLPCPRYGLFVA
jgi:hypothetical protein